MARSIRCWSARTDLNGAGGGGAGGLNVGARFGGGTGNDGVRLATGVAEALGVGTGVGERSGEGVEVGNALAEGDG